jgi:peptidoglycan-associated lipoprotein
MTTNRPLHSLLPALALATIVFAAGCGKKAPLPPPPPPAPTASNQPTDNSAPVGGQRATITAFAIEPSTVERGQTALLRWAVANSTDISIDNGIGTVPASGTRSITPNQTITYTLTANSPAGNATATATVTVTGPPPPPAPPARPNRGSFESRVVSDLRDAFFDYDSNNIRDDARAALNADADALKRIFADFPSATVALEGHCDERGSAEYNLGLGDRRSTSARDFLVQLGIPADKIKTISYGKERPVCTEATEDCWQKNRRAHFTAGQ